MKDHVVTIALVLLTVTLAVAGAWKGNAVVLGLAGTALGGLLAYIQAPPRQ
jgi:hypothetical protein